MTHLARARPADLDALVELVTEFCAVDRHAFDDERVRAGPTPLLDDDALGQVWLIMAEDALVGYVVVTWGWSLESGGREALIDEAYVRDRGRGVGSAALRAVVDEARRAGARSIYLETERLNEAARRFYRRHGFAEDDSIWMLRVL